MANLAPVKSTNLRGVGYDAETQQLAVQFQNGSTYMHYGVPPAVYSSLMSAQSKGTHYHQNIRGAYRTEKLEPKPTA